MITGTTTPRPQDKSQRPASLRWWLALPAAALGGFCLDVATPSVAWWPAAFLGVLLILSAIWQQRAWLGLMLGMIAGAAFWLPHIFWLTLYLGPIPWLALSSVMIGWFALFGLLGAIATRGLSFSLLAQAFAIAGLWVAREQVQSTWPYGGFAWGRLAHTQADGPLAALVSWLGFAGLSGLIVFACALTVALAFSLRRIPRPRAVVSGLAVVASLALLSIVPPASLLESGTLRIGAVQGNSKSGIFDDRENGDVFAAHFDASELLLEQLEADGASIDLLVWPENSGEFMLSEHPYRASVMRNLAKRFDAPIAVGTVLQHPDGTFTNSSIVFDAEGNTGLRYDKRRPVPFAEYMPNRAFFRSIVPELIDLVQLDYAFGTLPAAFAIDTPGGTVQTGIAICFDIIFDDHARALMRDGASVILAQTNNADFGRTDESAQQLQIARLRAIETGRAVVNISTVGTSAVILPDGRDAAALTPFAADAMVAEVPLVHGETPALRFGAVIAGAWITIGLAGAGVGAVRLRRHRLT